MKIAESLTAEQQSDIMRLLEELKVIFEIILTHLG